MATAVESGEQTDDNVRLVSAYLSDRVELVLNNASLVDEEVLYSCSSGYTNFYHVSTLQFVGNVVDVLSELQEWPEGALQMEDNGAR